jgi:DnaJ-domain-containing protein 1
MAETKTAADRKTKEQLEKEQAEAKEKLESLLSMNRPKNLTQGVSKGVNNIVGGAIGGVGVAVLAPTLGLGVGLKQGGIIGGALGLVGGAVIGVLGGAGLIVGGALSGVTQVVRGVVAQPQAMMAPRQGKWWNDIAHDWVFTDLRKVDVPDNDDDLLKKIEEELDESGKIKPSSTGEVKDTYYYDLLEVDPKAEQSAIKRRYYILARKYHPDKIGHEDKEGADKFKDVAEAYQVLSDPQLREKYDLDGRDGLSGDRTEANGNKMEPDILFAFLFGSDRFKDYIGRLSTATSAMVGDSPKLSIKEARTLQVRRCTRLALKLVSKLDQWVAEDFDMCKTLWLTEAEDLSTASYGWELVRMIGMVSLVYSLMFCV